MRVKRFVGNQLREMRLRVQMRQAQMRGAQGHPKVLFFPSDIAQGSSLLRVYNVAQALQLRGWNTHVVPKQMGLSQRRRLIQRFAPDLVVFQKSWHPLNTPDYAFGRPFVFDLDDADFLDPAHTQRLIDLVSGARGVIAGSRYVAQWCQQHNPRTQVIWTGTPVSAPTTPPPSHRLRAPIITWAQAQPLGYPAELAFVRDVFAKLAATGAQFTIRLYGVDTDEDRNALEQTLNLGVPLQLLPRMDYAAFCASLHDVALGMSPVIHASEYSRGKSFGKILSYLDAKVPVLTSDAVDHGQLFAPGSGLVSNDVEDWVAYAQQMLADPAARDATAQAGFELLQTHLSLEAVTDKVAAFLQQILSDPASGVQ